ncbi:MAG TPA: hypothetical protein VFN71_03855, partial [Methylomirabilota bacterium]|nr:hypothetical protein [Methylomirabilota bacterium]
SPFALLAIVTVLVTPIGAGEISEKHSGTVLAVERSAGTLVLGEVGPWRVKDGKTEITRQAIAVSADTQFVSVKRAEGVGPTGWVLGEWVTAPLPAWQVKEGDFVTIEARRDRGHLTALTVTVVPPIGP